MLRIGGYTLQSKLLLAPIAGYTDLSFRLAIRPLGGLGLACTELLNPRGLLERTRKSLEIAGTEPGDDPLAVQLYGAEPGPMADAARLCADRGAPIVDINMGCPARQVVRKSGGAALLCRPDHAVRLVERVARAVPIPVTVKIRLGWDDNSLIAPQLAADLERAGAAAITVHARTMAQGYRPHARWEWIARVVEAVREIPIIGNGDVRSPQDADRLIRTTGCAGVMIGRSALKQPWIFRDTAHYLATGRLPDPPGLTERLALVNRHFEHLFHRRGERIAVIIFRQQGCRYRGLLPECRAFRERIASIRSAGELRGLLRDPEGSTSADRPDPAGRAAAPCSAG